MYPITISVHCKRMIVLAALTASLCGFVSCVQENNAYQKASNINKPDSSSVRFNAIRGFSEQYPKPNEMKALRALTTQLATDNPKKLFVSGNPSAHCLALTFDDAPNRYTSTILDVLKTAEIKATFFCVGSNVARYPRLVKRMQQEGHIIANHSYNHIKITNIEPHLFYNEMVDTEKAIRKITNKSTALFRMPYGSIDQQSIDSLYAMGYTTIAWSLDTFDWLVAPSKALSIIDKEAKGGDIVLMHSRRATASMLPEIIAKIQQKNIRMVGIDSLLQINAYQ